MKRRELLLGGAGLLWLPVAATSATKMESAYRVHRTLINAARRAHAGESLLVLVDSRHPFARVAAGWLGAEGVSLIDIARRDLVGLWRERLERELASGVTLTGLTRYSDWQLLRGSAIHQRPRASEQRIEEGAAGGGTLFTWRLEASA